MASKAGPMGLALLLLLFTSCGKGPTTNSSSTAPPSPTPPTISLASLDDFQARLIEEARQNVTQHPQSADAWGKLGQHFQAVDFEEPARQCYARATELDPSSPRWLHLLGLLQLQNQPDSALANLERAAKLAGTQPDAPRLRLAEALVERGRFDEAMVHLQFILQSNPDHPDARLTLTRLKLSKNEVAGTAELLSPCLTNAFTARPANLLLAQIHQRHGDASAAAIAAQRAAALPRPFDWPDPYLREVQGMRADRAKLQDHINGLLAQNRVSDAESALAKLNQIFPNDPEALLLLGRLRLQQRQCDAAEQALRRYLEAESQSLNGTIQLSLALLCQARWQDGADVLRQAIAIKPDFAQAHFNLGIALSRSGDSAAAIRSFEDALRCSPGDPDTHTALAEEFLRAGNQTNAVTHLDRALQLQPNHPKARALRDRL